MALKITHGQPNGGNKVVPGKRLYLTADRSQLVEEGHPEAAFLYCSEGASVNREEYERLVGASEKELKSKTEDKDRSKKRATKSRTNESAEDADGE